MIGLVGCFLRVVCSLTGFKHAGTRTGDTSGGLTSDGCEHTSVERKLCDALPSANQRCPADVRIRFDNGHGNPAGWNVNSNQVTFLQATTAPRGEWTPRAARHTLRRYQAPSVQCGKCGMCKCRAAANDRDPRSDTARVGSRTVEADGQSRMLDVQDVRDMLLHPCVHWLIN